MRKNLSLAVMVGALVLAVGQAAAQPAPLFDHLKCYKVKPPKGSGKVKPTKYQLDLIPHQTIFNVEKGCRLVDKPKLFCIDVQKTNVQPPAPITAPGHPAQDYLCYKIKCPSGVKVPFTVTDQFGTRNLVANKSGDLLCVPAYKQGFPTPTPVAPTPTPTATPVDVCEKDAVTGTCAGPCPNADEICDIVPGTNICDCIKFGGCGLDASGQCAGPCPNPGDVCEFFPATNNCDCLPPPPRCEDFLSGQGLCGGPCPQNWVCDDDAPGLACRCYPTFPCGSAVDATCGGYCPVGEHCAPFTTMPGCGCKP